MSDIIVGYDSVAPDMIQDMFAGCATTPISEKSDVDVIWFGYD